MNPLETSVASCRSWQDSVTQEWISSPPSEDYTLYVSAAHDTGEALTTLARVPCFPRPYSRGLRTYLHSTWLQLWVFMSFLAVCSRKEP